MSGGGVKNIFDPAGVFHDNGSVKGQGFFDQGGALNSQLDPLDIFGGRASGQAKQQTKQQAADQAAILADAQSSLDSILAGGQPPTYGADGKPINGSSIGQAPVFGGINQGIASYQPQQILYPNLLQSPTNRQQDGNHIPLLAQRSFNQVLNPFQQPNWGVPQVNPTYLTGITRFPNGQVPNGDVTQPQGLAQIPQRQGIQPINKNILNKRVWL